MTKQDIIDRTRRIERYFNGNVEVKPDEINGKTFCVRTLIDKTQITEYFQLDILEKVAIAMLTAEERLSIIKNDGKQYKYIKPDEARHLIKNGVSFLDLTDMDNVVPHIRYSINGERVPRREVITRIGRLDWLCGVQSAMIHGSTERNGISFVFTLISPRL